MSDITSLIIAVIVFIAVYYFVSPYFGIMTGLPAIAFSLFVLFALRYFEVLKKFPIIPINKITSGQLAVVTLIIGVFFLGIFSSQVGTYLPFLKGTISTTTGLVSGTTTTTTTTSTSVADCTKEKIGTELWGKTSTINVNAYDADGTTPSTAVDSSWAVFDNGVYVGVITDTTAGTFTGAVVGDVLDFYAYGTSYYGDTIKGYCVNGQVMNLNFNVHALVEESDMSVVGYDKAMTALTAGTASESDYYITMGAGAETKITAELTQGTSDDAFNLGGIATATFYNMTSVVPQSFNFGGHYAGATSTYTFDSSQSTPLWLKSVNVLVNETSSAKINKDYTVYLLNKPILMYKYEYVDVPFLVDTSTNHISATTHGTTSLQGFAILFVDSQGSVDADKVYHMGIHDYSSSQANVGLSETATSPIGKQDGMLVEVR